MSFIHLRTSNIHVLPLVSLSSKREASELFRSTSCFDRGSPFKIMGILPCMGIRENNILHPVQPLFLAVSERGFLFSTISSVKKNFGTTHQSFAQNRSPSYLRIKKSGLVLPFILSTKVEYAPSAIFLPIRLQLFSSYSL